MSEFKALVGIDWGSVHHQVVLVDTAGQLLGDRSFQHDGAGLAAMADWILKYPRLTSSVRGFQCRL